MTEIGRMIWEEGRRLGKREILNYQLIKKFKKLSPYYEEKINSLSETVIEVIALEIFDIETVEDLEKYF
ncbi:hypothetical protein CFOLD11_11950 [Clostridium folliculivorans]|uniref:DUF4351 domain-containing protein n=1 Tax=Clostridium folliculivorans TaxID=2886038 RepID=A0A9W5Y0B0_9CLOT|nr:DUF4351 domain-containing protein [Clostridium folliculivorans]GKU24369.1 hypothetical protein CFOLD11_11950 [Clostridium folliculivorans]